MPLGAPGLRDRRDKKGPASAAGPSAFQLQPFLHEERQHAEDEQEQADQRVAERPEDVRAQHLVADPLGNLRKAFLNERGGDYDDE